MADVKEFFPQNFRIDNLLKSAALSAVLGTACFLPMTANAQTSPVSPNAVIVGTGPTTNGIDPIVNDTYAGAPPAIDYRILGNPAFNYAQIRRAQALGLDDREIAEAIAVAHFANVPTSDVLDQVGQGWTFATIASNYGVTSDWTDPAYVDKLHDYMVAYRHTGRGALRMAGNFSESPMSTGSLSGGMVASIQTNDILQTLQSSGNFTMFTRALHRTGLDATLESAGPYTVFAPTDQAFAKIPGDQRKSLMRDRSELRQVLEYHIIPAQISAAQAMAMTSPTSPATLEGDSLQVTTSNGTVMVNNATVTTPDIQASNGVIHAVDTVLMPSSVGAQFNNQAPAVVASPTTIP